MNRESAAVDQAVIPVAGLATRWLPLTKILPKELIPLAGRPLIEYAFDELIDAGISRVILVINPSRPMLKRYLARAPELERQLRERGKGEMADLLRTPEERGLKVEFATQDAALGLGNAVRCSAELVGDSPFAVLLPDEVFASHGGALPLRRLLEAYRRTGASCLAVQSVPWDKVSAYGVVDPADTPSESPEGFAVRGMVEKPAREDAPSQYSAVGRYVLRPEVMAALCDLEPGAQNEIQLTDGIAATVDLGVRAVTFASRRLDCGTVASHAQANALLTGTWAQSAE